VTVNHPNRDSPTTPGWLGLERAAQAQPDRCNSFRRSLRLSATTFVPPSVIELIALVRNHPRNAVEGSWPIEPPLRRIEPEPDEPQRGQRTVEHWRGETLPMGLRYEAAAVDFWTDVATKAAGRRSPKR
jgi:hypothetical protein